MSQMMADPNKASSIGAWTPWIAIALIATIAGLLLPQMMQGENVLSVVKAKADPKDKSKAEYTAPTLPDAPNFQSMLIRLGGGTIVVLGLCVSTLWGIRRWLHPLQQANVGSREMQLKETLNLGNRCSLHLVHLGKREVLIGVDSAGIKVIVPLPNGFEEVLAQTEPPIPGAEETNLLPRWAA